MMSFWKKIQATQFILVINASKYVYHRENDFHSIYVKHFLLECKIVVGIFCKRHKNFLQMQVECLSLSTISVSKVILECTTILVLLKCLALIKKLEVGEPRLELKGLGQKIYLKIHNPYFEPKLNNYQQLLKYLGKRIIDSWSLQIMFLNVILECPTQTQTQKCSFT